MNIGTLFSGIEGFGIGMEWAGILTGEPVEILWQVEIDEWSRGKLAETWPNAERFADVKEVGKHNLKPVDLICGGPPCQPVSVAGKRGGKEDDRWLWPEALRVVAEIMPRWVVFENPPGILGMVEFDDAPPVDGEGCAAGNIGDVYTRVGRGYTDEILETLRALGYTVEVFNIPACGVGAMHRRERVWIVANRIGERCRAAGERGSVAGVRGGRTNDAMPTSKSDTRGPLADDPRQQDDGRERGHMAGAERARGCEYAAAESGGEDVADRPNGRIRRGSAPGESGQFAQCGEDVPLPSRELREGSGNARGRRAESANGGEDVSDTELDGLQGSEPAGGETPGMRRRSTESGGTDVPDNPGLGIQGNRTDGEQESGIPAGERLSGYDDSGAGADDRLTQSRLGFTPDDLSALIAGWPHVAPLGMAQYDFEPPRLAGKVPDRAKWLKALGNAVVPILPMVIGCMIIEQIRQGA